MSTDNDYSHLSPHVAESLRAADRAIAHRKAMAHAQAAEAKSILGAMRRAAGLDEPSTTKPADAKTASDDPSTDPITAVMRRGAGLPLNPSRSKT